MRNQALREQKCQGKPTTALSQVREPHSPQEGDATGKPENAAGSLST